MRAKVLQVAALVMGGLAFVTLMVGFVLENANPNIRDDDTVFELRGPPDKIEEEGNRLRLTFWWTRVIMLVDSTDADLVATLKAQAAEGESVNLRATLSGAHFEPGTGQPVFWLTSMEHKAKEYGPFGAHPRWSWRVLRDEQVAVLKGIAHHGNGATNLALSEYNRSLDTKVLRGEQRGIAFWARATVYESRSRSEPSLEGRDYYLVRAFEDYSRARKWLKEDYHVALAQAEALLSLGAFDEALKLFAKFSEQWPDHRFAAIRSSVHVLRKRGHYEEALRALDSVSRDSAERDHMPYHYHRGWTLLLLERYPEATAEFTAGLAFQKNWIWAYAGRACAGRAIGALEAAVADLRKAIEIYASQMREDSDDDQVLMAELRHNARALEAQRTRGAPVANVSVCQRFEPGFDEPLRERSKVLGVLSAQVSSG
jgi:tetratricopeptide (TPR) repeat protein